MEFRCLICESVCKLCKGKTVPVQLEQWRQECPKKFDEDGITWIFNLGDEGLDREQCLCRTCSGLLSELEGYESLARGVRAELLQRHEAGRSALVLVAEGEESQQPVTPLPPRSRRRSGGLSASQTSPPTTEPVPEPEPIMVMVPVTSLDSVMDTEYDGRDHRPSFRRSSPVPFDHVLTRTEGDGEGDSCSVKSGRSFSARNRGRGRGAPARSRGALASGRSGGGNAMDIAGDKEPASMDKSGVEAIRDAEMSGGVASQPAVEIKQETMEAMMEDSLSDDGGREDAGDDGMSDDGSEYAPSPVPADDGDMGDTSDGGVESDDAGDADYEPGRKKPPQKLSRKVGNRKDDGHYADTEPGADERQYTGMGYTCSRCGLGFKSRIGFKLHERRSHSDANGRNKCSTCPKTFKRRGSLITHQRMVHGKGQRCPHCDVVFRRFVDYHRHLADAHDNITYICDHCGAGFANRVLLKKHKKEEVDKLNMEECMKHPCSLKCSVCDFRPPLTQDLRVSTVYSMIKDHEHKAHGMHGVLEPGRGLYKLASRSAPVPVADSPPSPRRESVGRSKHSLPVPASRCSPAPPRRESMVSSKPSLPAPSSRCSFASPLRESVGSGKPSLPAPSSKSSPGPPRRESVGSSKPSLPAPSSRSSPALAPTKDPPPPAPPPASSRSVPPVSHHHLPAPPSPPQRSSRPRQPPVYLRDYVAPIK